MTRLEELETLIGPPSEFIFSKQKFSILREWAELTGTPAAQVAIMSGVELANLYHASADKRNGPQPSELQHLAADMFLKIMGTVSGLNADAVRAIVKEELANLPSRKIEIVTERGTVTVDGLIHYAAEKVIKLASIGHAIMLVGPAGCGKTSIGETVAKALQLPFYITSTINEPHELTGFIDGHGKYHSTPFRNAFENGGVWIADEIDAWDAAALLAANSALANGYCVFPDVSNPIRRHDSFRMVATANTFGNGADRIYIGRNELDAASLDRFATVNVDYDLTIEQALAGSNQKWLEYVWKIRKIVNEKKIRHVVSTRAIVRGSEALNIGLDWKDVEEWHLFKGMSKSDREKCK